MVSQGVVSRVLLVIAWVCLAGSMFSAESNDALAAILFAPGFAILLLACASVSIENDEKAKLDERAKQWPPA